MRSRLLIPAAIALVALPVLIVFALLAYLPVRALAGVLVSGCCSAPSPAAPSGEPSRATSNAGPKAVVGLAASSLAQKASSPR